MKGKTIHEIEADYSRELTELQQEYYRAIDDVRSMRNPEAASLSYLDRLSPAGRAEVLHEQLHEQKNEAKDEARGRALARYHRATEERREAIEPRKARLGARLYHVEDGRLVAETVRASDEELPRVLAAAIRTGSRDLAKAVFAEADARGLSNLVDEYFTRVDPEARELYTEYQAVPTREQLETAAEQAEMFVHEPSEEMLRYGPQVTGS